MVRYDLNYDESNPLSIEKYAQKLIGKTFQNVCDEDILSAEYVMEQSTYNASHENKNRKGGLGEIIEERFFHYKANNDSRPDFYKAGVELKVTPYKINQNGSLSAKERLIITMIDYFAVINESFEDSHFWNKARLILIIYYLYERNITNRLDYRIDFAKLFSPPESDKKIIMHDFDIIVGKVKAGLAHELSGGDTLYLEAAPKAASSADRRKQPNSTELAKPRAFAFKNSYMTYVLNNYIVPGKDTFESILDGDIEEDFESYVSNKIYKYHDYSVKKLCEIFDVNLEKKPKNLEAMLAYRILGIKGNHAEEFQKANIAVKAIRIEKTDKIKEHMSFPTFKFKELIREEWESSTFGDYLRDTKFMFVVYKYNDDGELLLKGCQFWNIPYNDLETDVKEVWLRTKQVLVDGLQITEKNGKRYNNFPKQKDNRVSHVRPHGQNADDTYELPDGRQYTKQCFWLNNSYIYSQIKDELKS